jgi:uncharacterized Zn finger protein
MGWHGDFAPYVPVAARRANAQRQAEKLKKKLGRLEPVVVDGRSLARSWWGKSWNQNLERYADYANRIGRGRSYLMNGMVLDLQIDKETIRGIVAGTASAPYEITIRIKAISDSDWNRLVQKAMGKIETLQTLLEGKFPEELKDLFFTKEAGVFPAPSEIKLECSCPDWAVMCKHVAAVLYGVGTRLDTSPELFFTLRGVNMDDLIGQVARKEAANLLSRPAAKSSRIIQPTDGNLSDIGALFGIALTLDAPVMASIKAKKPSKGAKTADEPHKRVGSTVKNNPKNGVRKRSIVKDMKQ